MFPINQIINVTSFYFANGRNFKSYPRQIEFGNTRFTFTDGIQYIVKQGEKAIKLFDMTDGTTTYRLRQDNDNWTLLGTR
jgi:hypothetical protein